MKILKKIFISSFFVIGVLSLAPRALARDLFPNTFVGAHYHNFSGDRENSFVNNESYGVSVISTPHRSHFRLHYGAIVSYADGRAYVQSERKNTTLYSTDALIGLSVYPIVERVKIRPFFEAGGLGGIKYLEIINPPEGVDTRATGLSFGYRIAIGLETSFTNHYGLRFSADYISNKANIANASQFQFDGFAFNLGFYF